MPDRPPLDTEAIRARCDDRESSRMGFAAYASRVLPAACDEIDELSRQVRAKVKELEADKARLDWLGAQPTATVTMLVNGRYLDHGLHGTDMTIREAIDAYRRGGSAA